MQRSRGPHTHTNVHSNANTPNEITIAKKIKFVSPFGTAQYPHLSSPDTQGKFADNKYKTKLVKPAGDPEAQAFKATIDNAAREIHGAKGDKLYKPYVEDEDSNTITFNFKTQYAPAIFDSKNQQVKERVGAGSVLRVSGVFVEYEKGITAQINQVQVRELNGAGVSHFDTIEDGFVSDASATASSFDSDDNTAQVAPNAAAALDI